MKKISIVCPTFNEEDNVETLVSRIENVMSRLDLDYEIIFIDNSSTDSTMAILRGLANEKPRIKVIQNARNFGHIRSPYYGLLQTESDAAVLIASDLQDPPELILDFVDRWYRGEKIVLAVKKSTDEKFPMSVLRKSYYALLQKISDAPLVRNATGAGLFDSQVIRELRLLKEPYPYFRGLITEIGFPVATVEFHQPKRAGGKTKNNFLTLLDIALLGITTHGQASIRAITIGGLFLSLLSLAVAFCYLIAKLVFWDYFEFGLAPLLFGVFFLGSVQIFLMGLLGEFLVNILRRLQNMPLVIERERINF